MWCSVALTGAMLIATACGSHAPAPAPKPTRSPAPHAPAPVKAVVVQNLGPLLPAALVGTAAAPSGGRIYVMGGSGPAGFSDQVYTLIPPSGSKGTRVVAVGRLPQPLHDAAAVPAASGVLLCGGGRNVGHSTVYHVLADGAVTLAGAMPRSLSDLTGVTAAGGAYCLGGWTGHLYSDAVYNVSALAGSAAAGGRSRGAAGAGGSTGAAGGAAVTLAAHLPHAVRYAAADGLPGGVLVAGGMRYTGKLTADLQWVPLGGAASGAPSVVGRLPAPLYYAMGAVLDGTALVVGGCSASGGPVATIEAVSPTGTVTKVGSLPHGLCYGSAAALGGAVYVFGGETAGARASRDVWRISPAKP